MGNFDKSKQGKSEPPKQAKPVQQQAPAKPAQQQAPAKPNPMQKQDPNKSKGCCR
jgi:hypothetical protein